MNHLLKWPRGNSLVVLQLPQGNVSLLPNTRMFGKRIDTAFKRLVRHGLSLSLIKSTSGQQECESSGPRELNCWLGIRFLICPWMEVLCGSYLMSWSTRTGQGAPVCNPVLTICWHTQEEEEERL